MGELLPDSMWLSVWIAGVMLFIMSMMDTLAYGVRTAGVLARRLAMSLSLFNSIVIFSRLSNMLQAPVLGTFSDGTYVGSYTTADVLRALRIDLLFVVAGVLLGALLMPTFVRLFQRGIEVLEEKGTAPRTAVYALAHIGNLPAYLHFPNYVTLRPYFNAKRIPYDFLIWNIFVTAFYSIGVMSTVLAASIDHSVASTAILLSGIVNGIATMLLFIIVDPPASIVIDQCINGKRPVSDAKTLNLYLVLTRLAGTILAIALLPLMGRYVLTVAHWVNNVLVHTRAGGVV